MTAQVSKWSRRVGRYGADSGALDHTGKRCATFTGHARGARNSASLEKDHEPDVHESCACEEVPQREVGVLEGPTTVTGARGPLGSGRFRLSTASRSRSGV